MAAPGVVPKKKNYIPWVLLALGLIALVIFLVRRYSASPRETDPMAVQPRTDTIAATGVETITSSDGWGSVDRYGQSALDYPEMKDNKAVNVRGNEHFAVYDLGEDVLFKEGDSTILPDAAAQLATISASIEQHFKGAPIRLFGFTDAQGNAAFNKALALARAEAVKTWLADHGNIKASRMSIEAVGEESPKSTNNTAAGRKENRRVQIVVKQS